MKKIVLTFGVISGLISAGLMLANVSFVYRIGFDKGLYIGYTVIVLSFLMVFFGIRSYRETVGGGQISFGRAFSVGILITLISCAFYVGMWLIVYYNFLPDFGDKYGAYIIEQSRAAGASAEEIAKQTAEMKDMKRLLDNPFLNAAVTFLEPFPVGLIITLISALVLRRRRAAPAEPELVSTRNLHNAQSQ
jgi:hypothetical protein